MKDINLLAMVLVGINEFGTDEILNLINRMTADKEKLAEDIKAFCKKYKINIQGENLNE